jgi:hypothetical protein
VRSLKGEKAGLTKHNYFVLRNAIFTLKKVKKTKKKKKLIKRRETMKIKDSEENKKNLHSF